MDDYGSYFSDLIHQAAVGLGVDTGANAAKTIGTVGKAVATPPANSTGAVVAASATPATPMIFGMDQKTAIIVGAGLVLVVIVVATTGK